MFDESQLFFTAFCTVFVPIVFLYSMTKIVRHCMRGDPQNVTVTDLQTIENNRLKKRLRIEAGRWLRQAKHDYDSARNDLHADQPAYEWVCIKCQQAVEKVLKAVFIRKNMDDAPVAHDLVELAGKLEDADLNGLAVSLQGTIGFVSRMRYPDMVPHPKVPHDVYTRQDAETAYADTGHLMDHIRNKYLRGCEIQVPR